MVSAWPKDYVCSVLEGLAIGEGQKGVGTHDDDFSRRLLPKVLHILWKSEHEVVRISSYSTRSLQV